MMDFRRPAHDPDLEVELTLLPTENGGRKGPMFSGIRMPHDFGLPGELNDGMYEFLDGGCLHPGWAGRAFLWLHAPERNAKRVFPGMEFAIIDGRVIGKGRILWVLNVALCHDGARQWPRTDSVEEA